MTVASVPGSGLANVHARIAAIQAQIAALAPSKVLSSAVPLTGGTSAAAAGGTSADSFAAALGSAVDRHSLSPGGAAFGPGAGAGFGPGLGAGVGTGIGVLAGAGGAGFGTAGVAGVTAAIGAGLLPGASAVSSARPVSPVGAGGGTWVMPAQGRTSSGYGPRHGVAGRGSEFHTGLDIAAPQGTPVRAASAGIVKSAGSDGNYGNAVVIDHGNGVTTRYAHNSALHVRPGQQVRAGDTIAAIGSTGRSTGPHLHFEVRVNGDDVDPVKWLRDRAAPR